MNYKIITDEQELRTFIQWLPDLEVDETYYCSLIARKKYVKDIPGIVFKADKMQLKRFTSDKDWLFDKIKQLECEVGSYIQKGLVVPQEALAFYITPNPRNLQKAARASVKRLLDLLEKPYNGYNPHQEVMSEIQRAFAKKRMIDFDFDVPYTYGHAEYFDQVLLTPMAYNILQTRGGFHLLVHIDSVAKSIKNTWYQKIATMEGVDIAGDNLVPVPGTIQGGFTPRLIQ
jgi:hypothetical protein